ncbi:MAG TPA: hypothetical protein VFU00_05790 [Gemmatimonadales bacterium]|nr:hypothetical protein [Gemmatimonadales bacterium]
MPLSAGCEARAPGAEAARADAPCTPPTVWPQLPAVESIMGRNASPADAAASRLRDSLPVDPSVVVPQYAFVRSEDGSRCDPAIVVEARRGVFVYWGVDLTSSGEAAPEQVELLGTDRATAH